MFERARFTREAQYDVENFKLITQAAMKRSEQLTTPSGTYSPARLVQALHRHGWNGRGRRVQLARARRRSLSRVSCASRAELPLRRGRQAREGKEARAARKEKAADDGVAETQFEEIKEDNKIEEEATNHRAEEMDKILTKLMADATSAHRNAPGAPRFEVLPTLDNPGSFHQTVGNLSDFSFCVKQGNSSLEIGEDGVPVTNVTGGPDGAVAKKQIVVSLNMHSPNAIQDAWGLSEPHIPHRTFIGTSGTDGGAAASAAGGCGAASSKKKGKAPLRKK